MFKKEYIAGKEFRNKASRRSQAKWKLPPKRPSAKKMLEVSNYDRLPDLVPIRHRRMAQSPFTFYLATASIMARDPFHSPSTGINVQACGDCHLMNFGGFATPERNIVADINDFDETSPEPWEWDLKRLATSFLLPYKSKGFDK